MHEQLTRLGIAASAIALFAVVAIGLANSDGGRTTSPAQISLAHDGAGDGYMPRRWDSRPATVRADRDIAAAGHARPVN